MKQCVFLMGAAVCAALAGGLNWAGSPDATVAPAVRPPAAAVEFVAARRPSADELSRRLQDGHSLLLESAVFDPLTEALPEFAAGREVRGTEQTFLVQFQRDLSDSERQRFEAAGVRLLDYIPSHAYVVRAAADAFAGRLAADPLVRWLDAFRGGYKLATILRSEAWTEGLYLDIRVFPDEGALALIDRLRAIDGAVRLIAVHGQPAKGQTVRVLVPAGHLHPFADLASQDGSVWTVSPWYLPRIQNDDSIWVVQSFDTTNKTDYGLSAALWNHGITGTGQTPGVSDTGIDDDMCFFRDSNSASEVTAAQFPTLPGTGTIDLTRKVAAYYVMPNATAYDGNTACQGIPESYHGTHTSGTIVGDNYSTPSSSTSGGHDGGDGMAPNARVIFQDIGSENSGCLEGLNNDFHLIARQAYDAGVRIHSNSWGSDVGGAYTSFSGQIDEITYDREDLLFVFSAGNSGSGANTIGSPATAKDCLTVGATGHAASSFIASFSSRGPTDDGRLKPDIVAPGESVVSASGDSNHTSNNCGTKTLSGTSMAAPTVAGGATLLRQYFVDGFYPSGAKLAVDSLGPSAALLKAALINGAIDIQNTTQSTMFNSLTPNNNQGFGRIQLDNVAFFSTPTRDARRTRLWDKWNDTGLTTGQIDEYPIQVTAGQPLKVALAWTDPPASLAALTQLVNNLDLEVLDPSNNVYRGNVFGGGQSVAGGSADLFNTIEVVFLKTPAAGTWTLRVKGTAIPGSATPYSTRQGYALVATYGDCTVVPFAPLGLAVTDQGASGIDLTWNTALGAARYQIYRAEGSCAAPAMSFRYIGQSTTTSFADTLVQGGASYAYKVRGVTNCNEGVMSTCMTATSSGNCTLYPSFDGLTSATNDVATPGCDSLLGWNSGASNCTLGPGVTYDVYRSATPYFTPGPATLLAAGASGPTYSDPAVTPNTAYFYVVRAEDTTTQNNGPSNGGNTDTNLLVRSVTPTSQSTYPGTWSDDADTAARVSYQAPWRVSNQQNHSGGGTLAYHSAPDAQTYPPSVCAELITPPIALQAGQSPVLTYWAKYDLESQWDGVVVEISNNGGSNWSDLPPTGGYPSNFAQTGNPPINACAYASTHGAFSGTALTQWTQYTTPLAAFAGQTVLLRFRFSSDPGAEFEGFYLDDVAVTKAWAPASCGTDLRLASNVLPADSCVGGAGNGTLDAGEDATLAVSLQNIGDATATSVSGTLTSSAPGVAITRSSVTFPAVASGSIANSAAPHFGVWVAPSVACGTVLPFTLQIASAQGNSIRTFNLAVGSGAPCSQTVCTAALPVEDGVGVGMLQLGKSAGGDPLQISFGLSCHAVDSTVYWGQVTGPMTGVTWNHAACGFGPQGAANISPGTPAPGEMYYFVAVPSNGLKQGSYGRDSSGAERPAATGLGACNLPRQLGGSCP